MKRPINIKFVGFSSACPIEERLFYKLIARNFEIRQSERPDYVFFEGADWMSHYLYDDSVKIICNGENIVPDFNNFDYAIGFDYLTFGDRYLRSPLFARYASFDQLINREHGMSDEQLLDREFCSFVVSNADFGDPIRKKFFERISKYKKVASGGRWMNNVGGPVKDKIAFCRRYKFCIAFENSSIPGYTTEKVMEAYAAESVPIYWGNPQIEKDFRMDSMVCVMGVEDIERAMEEIIRLDRDDAAYLATCHERFLAVENPRIYSDELERFLVHIFDQPLGAARRRCKYGLQRIIRDHMSKIVSADRFLLRPLGRMS